MANKQLRKAMEFIRDDEALTGDLADTEAKALLDWAEGQVTQWLTQFESVGGTAAWKMLEPQLHALRLHLRQIARVAARSAEPALTIQTLLAQPYSLSQPVPPAAPNEPPAAEPAPELPLAGDADRAPAAPLSAEPPPAADTEQPPETLPNDETSPQQPQPRHHYIAE